MNDQCNYGKYDLLTFRDLPVCVRDASIVSFEEGGGYRQEDAGGFIRLSGLRLRIRALVERTAR